MPSWWWWWGRRTGREYTIARLPFLVCITFCCVLLHCGFCVCVLRFGAFHFMHCMCITNRHLHTYIAVYAVAFYYYAFHCWFPHLIHYFLLFRVLFAFGSASVSFFVLHYYSCDVDFYLLPHACAPAVDFDTDVLIRGVFCCHLPFYSCVAVMRSAGCCICSLSLPLTIPMRFGTF